MSVISPEIPAPPCNLKGKVMSKIPDVADEYWAIVQTMEEHPFMYGLDKMRSEVHERLCLHYKITEEQSRTITDNLNKVKNATQMHNKLKEISNV